MDSNILCAKGKSSKGMGRGRSPCCDKTHVNRGPWSPAEDLRLISFIQKYGHDNWRALPKQAGLLRCGKSCRLRWVNYRRPDLKRGNFTKEEEETIIRLHRAFGNKWSRIAAHLPGRTDNEIKNVWNAHLKKKLAQNASWQGMSRESSVLTSSSSSSSTVESKQTHQRFEINSQVNMLPHFSKMKTVEMELPNINLAPMASQMTKHKDTPPLGDFVSMNQHSEQFLDSYEIGQIRNNQLDDFSIWNDPNVLDSLLNVDEEPFRVLPPPSIQLDPPINNPSHGFLTEPDFDLWSILNYDPVSALANPIYREADKIPIVETPMMGKNMNSANECLTDEDINSLFKSLENVPEPSPGLYQSDVPKCSSPTTSTDNDDDNEMMDLDSFLSIPPEFYI